MDNTPPVNKEHNQAAPNTVPAELPGAFSLLKPSWHAIKLNFITLVEFIIIPLILSLLSTLMPHLLHSTNHSGAPAVISTAINLLSGILSLMFAPGMTYTLLKGTKGERIDFYPAFRAGLTYFWRYLGVTICTTFLIVVGLILLIVPGIFMIRRYFLAPYYLIDRDLGIFETLRTCKSNSKQFGNKVLGVFCVQALFIIILIIPVLGWIAGVILSIMYYSAPAIRYRQITAASGRHTEVSQPASPIS
jgi:uncharacterized membrane protein